MKCLLADSKGLSAQIENLGNLGPEELDQTWRALFGSERPRRVCGDLLIQALGYRRKQLAASNRCASPHPRNQEQKRAVLSWQFRKSALAGTRLAGSPSEHPSSFLKGVPRAHQVSPRASRPSEPWTKISAEKPPARGSRTLSEQNPSLRRCP